MKKRIFTNEQMNLFFDLVSQGCSQYKISKAMKCDCDTVRRLAKENNITYLQEHYNFSEKQKSEIRYLYENTQLSVPQIGAKLKLRDVDGYIQEYYTKEQRNNHYIRLLSNQKLGDKNPMKKRTGKRHPNYKGFVDDGNRICYDTETLLVYW